MSSLQKPLYWGGAGVKMKNSFTFHRSDKNLRFPSQRLRFKKSTGLVLGYSSSSTSASGQQVGSVSEKVVQTEGKRIQLGCLVSDMDWQVRRMVESEEEMRKVAEVQAEAFHEPSFMFDDLFFQFFKADVFSGLIYRLRNSSPDRYACLVAEQKSDNLNSRKELVGVVDVTVLREDDVLQHLPGADEYLYVSGIAVLNRFRRKKVATTLLKACSTLSGLWGFKYLVLRAYEDDHGARKLYSGAGYRVVSADPPWISTWIGKKRRVLMVKWCDMQ